MCPPIASSTLSPVPASLPILLASATATSLKGFLSIRVFAHVRSGSPWRPRRVLKQKLPLSGVSSLLTTLSFAKRYRSAGLRPRHPRTTLKKFAVGPVKSILHSQRNGGFGTHFDPSRGAPRKRAIRPIEASKAAICNGRFTSTPVSGRNAQW